MRNYLRSVALLGFGIGILLGALGCATSGRNKGNLNIYSVATDAKLGAHWADYVHKQMPMLFDERLSDYVNRVGQKIVALFPEDALFKYRFEIVKDPQVNAFALPGGYIFVNLGLLQVVETEAELISVLGHEMGHVVFRHGTEQLTKAQGWSCCLSIGAAALGLGPTSVDVINLFGQTGLLYYGRTAELEADTFGVESLYKANYDIAYAARFFEVLQKIQKGKPSLLDKLLSTHPLPKDRIKHAKSEAKKYPLQKNPVVSTPPFKGMKQILEKYPNKYKQSELQEQLQSYYFRHDSSR